MHWPPLNLSYIRVLWHGFRRLYNNCLWVCGEMWGNANKCFANQIWLLWSTEPWDPAHNIFRSSASELTIIYLNPLAWGTHVTRTAQAFRKRLKKVFLHKKYKKIKYSFPLGLQYALWIIICLSRKGASQAVNSTSTLKLHFSSTCITFCSILRLLLHTSYFISMYFVES